MELHEKLDFLLSLESEIARGAIEESIEALYERYHDAPASEKPVPD